MARQSAEGEGEAVTWLDDDPIESIDDLRARVIAIACAATNPTEAGDASRRVHALLERWTATVVAEVERLRARLAEETRECGRLIGEVRKAELRVRAAVLAEREECAQEADQIAAEHGAHGDDDQWRGAKEVAEAIRGRG